MLGLPRTVTACLFDLDGVLTQTAKVHAAAWFEFVVGVDRVGQAEALRQPWAEVVVTDLADILDRT